MPMDVEELERPKDPEVQGRHPDPYCSQETQVQQISGGGLGLSLIPDLRGETRASIGMEQCSGPNSSV